MNEQHPDSGRGSGKRGRPAVGKPEQVRLSETEKSLAIALGNGVLAKGVRVALDAAEQARQSSHQRVELDSLVQSLWPGKRLNEIDPLAIKRRFERLLQSESNLKKRVGQPTLALSEQDQKTAADLGEGDPEQGILIALSAARFLGYETARKLNNHGSGNAS